MENKKEEQTQEQVAGRKQRLVRYLRWAFINGLLWWCAWGAVTGSVGAGRVMVLTSWVLAILYLLIACNTEGIKPLKERGRSTPSWLCHGCDVALILYLVWYGWWMTSIAWIISTLAVASIYHKDSD